MRTMSILAVMVLGAGSLSARQVTQQAAQTDWSAGGGEVGPVLSWGDRFASSAGLSRMSIPGQLALSSTAVDALPFQRIGSGDGLFGVEIADLDGDGDNDVVTAADGDREVAWWSNEGGSPIVWTKKIIASALRGANGICVGDFDLDGRIDVVVAAASIQNDLIWWQNGGGDPITWTKEVIDAQWSSCYEVNVGDVNLDGRPDLIAVSWDLGIIAWWENGVGAPITWTKHVVDTGFTGAHSAKAADLDGDGDMDILAAAGQVDEVAWWRNDGGAPIVWTKFTIRTGYMGGRSVAFGDFDLDGDLDLAATCWENDVTWWRNDGGDPVVWVEVNIATGFTGGHHIQTADINGDGRLDLVAAGYMVSDVVWWENLGGTPVAWEKRMVRANWPRVTEIATGDLNGDGALDIAAVSYRTGGALAWWDPTDFTASGELESSILDTGAVFPSAKLDWTASEPLATDLRFQVRSSDDSADLGAWSSEIEDPALVGDLDRFVQYRALFTTTDPDVSPVLEEVSVSVPSVTVRNGSEVNPVVFTSTGLPLLGGTWTAEVDGGAVGVTSGFSLVCAFAAPLDPGAPLLAGELLVDPASPWLASDLVTATGAVCLHSIPIPTDLAFVGARASTQAFLGGAGGPGRLTNAIDLVLGH
jgi:hypothetical protein